jgi:predicted phosphodiesterase
MSKKMYRPRLNYLTAQELKALEQLIEITKKSSLEKLLENLSLLSLTRKKSENERWIVISDVHRPFHSKILWDKLLKLIRQMAETLTGIIVAGDYLDLFTLGSYNAESLGLLRDIDLDFEYRDGLDGILELESALHAGAKKKFLFGNHEDRYFRTLNSKDNAKFGAALKNPVEALQLKERGWEVKTDYKNDFFILGAHLEVMHGNFHGTHAAKQHLDRLHRSVIFGDTHRIQMYSYGTRAAYNIGGLYDMQGTAVKYAARTQRINWRNGFAIVDIDADGLFFVQQVAVWEEKFVVDGVMY